MSSDDSRIQDGEAKWPRVERTAASRGWPREEVRGKTEPAGTAPRASTSDAQTLSGPRYLASYLLALPVIVVTLASTGVDQVVSGAIALSWLVLAPTALYARRAAQVLPYLSFVFLGLALVLLRFNSVAFVVDVTATVIMFLVSMPRPAPGLPPEGLAGTRRLDGPRSAEASVAHGAARG